MPPLEPEASAAELRWGASQTTTVVTSALGGSFGNRLEQILQVRAPARAWHGVATLYWLNANAVTFVAPETVELFVEWRLGIGSSTHVVRSTVLAAAPFGAIFDDSPPSVSLTAGVIPSSEITARAFVRVTTVAGAARDFRYRVSAGVAPLMR